jgi:glucosamine--fructose-6-phosphate aminotransferase (isomerizing)
VPDNKVKNMMSRMRQEAQQASFITQQQLLQYVDLFPAIIADIKKFSPQFIMTVGRGSSDHAASFAKYVFETQLGLATSSAAPSVETIYHAPLLLDKALVIAFSQSGQSCDLCEVLSAAKKSGAFTIAFVNKTQSPLASIAHHIIPLYAGDEISVAATKSFIATLVAILAFTAYWQQDNDFLDKLSHLPSRFISYQDSWLVAAKDIAMRASILVLGRGFTFPIAMEAALKLKETCKLHAEAFSSAEVLHGPFALMQKNFPLIVFVPTDAAAIELSDLLDRLTTIATCTYLIVAENHAHKFVDDSGTRHVLPLPESLHPLCDPVIAIQAFYLMAEQCAQMRGINPDQPEHLSKVTNTR